MSVNYITIDESEFDELVAENAKLRKQVEDYHASGLQITELWIAASKKLLLAVEALNNCKNNMDPELGWMVDNALAEIERIGKS